MTISPIQTRYKGYLFRSRLEARWAVAFDRMGLKWEYEPEGYVLPSGRRYLPDFRIALRRSVLWVDVKPSGADCPPLEEFMQGQESSSIGTVLHDIPDPTRLSRGYYENDEPFALSGGGGWDNLHFFCACPTCEEVGFEFDGRSARVGCSCPIHAGSDKNYSIDHPKIANAFAAARAARFEHEQREVWR